MKRPLWPWEALAQSASGFTDLPPLGVPHDAVVAYLRRKYPELGYGQASPAAHSSMYDDPLPNRELPSASATSSSAFPFLTVKTVGGCGSRQSGATRTRSGAGE